MRIKALLFSFFILTFLSCKKESAGNIVGQWISTAVYALDETGNYRWIEFRENAHAERIHFMDNGTFTRVSDVPTGDGVYTFDRNSRKISLQYTSGNVIVNTPVILYVEKMDNEQLVLSSQAGVNQDQRTTYSRID